MEKVASLLGSFLLVKTLDNREFHGMFLMLDADGTIVLGSAEERNFGYKRQLGLISIASQYQKQILTASCM